MKKRITILGIWVIALTGIIASLYELYSFHTGNYDAEKFSDLSLNPKLIYWVSSICGILISIGLIIKNKLSRLIVLLLSYFGLSSLLGAIGVIIQINIEINGFKDDPLYVFITISLATLALLVPLFIVYLLSNKNALE